MKLPAALFLAFLAAAPLSAQYWPAGGFGSILFPAGRPPAGVNPFGSIVTPATPQGPAALATGRYATGRSYAGYGRRRGRTSSIYAYPVFVGGYGYGSNYAPADPSASNSAPADQPSQPAQPPVVINQYFGTPPPSQGQPDDSSSNFHYYQAPSNDDNPGPPSDPVYYLIAFKDHTVYSAVAYYTEGDTLHYFTDGNVHNQVSLSLVDRQLTEQLNREHNIEVHLP